MRCSFISIISEAQMKGVVMKLAKKRTTSPLPFDISRFTSKSPKPQTPERKNEFQTEDNEEDQTHHVRFPDSHISGATRTINQFDITHNQIDATKLMDVSMDPTTVQVPEVKDLYAKKPPGKMIQDHPKSPLEDHDELPDEPDITRIQDHTGGSQDFPEDLLDLWEACEMGDDQRASDILKKYLKDHHIDINKASHNDNCTALHLAVRESNNQIVKMLLKSGARVNVQAHGQQLPLHLAAIRGRPKIVHMLLEKTEAIDMRDDQGNTALHYAVMNDHYDVTRMLLKRNADPLAYNIDEKTTLDVCTNKEIKRALEKQIPKEVMKKLKKDEKKKETGEYKAHPRTNSMEFVIPDPSMEEDKEKEEEEYKPQIRNIKIEQTKQENAFNQDNLDTTVPEMKDLPAPRIRMTESLKHFTQLIRPGISGPRSKEERLGLDSFDPLQMLGKGSFGKVYLVRHVKTKRLFALKILEKRQLFGQNLTRYALTEKEVLKTSHHPFIVELHYAFQTSNFLYLVLQFCPGGDLGRILRKEKRLNQARAKFYAAEIILALEELHSRDIIFRDLKPDNVIIDDQGHARLTDFGLSKMGITYNTETKTFCGSVAYLAPQVLNKAGHGKAVDWYLVGVLMYEMLQGTPPYYDHNRQRMFDNIKFSPLIFKRKISDKAENIIRLLMIRDPKQRLGSKSVREIKGHPFFKGVMWDQLYKKSYKPPAPNKKEIQKKVKFTLKMLDEDCPDKDKGDRKIDTWTFVRG